MDHERDLFHFSQLKLWYKILPCSGKYFVVFPWKGYQPKNYLDRNINDIANCHWHFWRTEYVDELPFDDDIKTILFKYKIPFNCFLYNDTEVIINNWEVILKNNPCLNNIIKNKYNNLNLSEIINIERNSQLELALEKLNKLYIELYNFDYKLFEIKMSPKMKRRSLDFNDKIYICNTKPIERITRENDDKLEIKNKIKGFGRLRSLSSNSFKPSSIKS